MDNNSNNTNQPQGNEFSQQNSQPPFQQNANDCAAPQGYSQPGSYAPQPKKKSGLFLRFDTDKKDAGFAIVFLLFSIVTASFGLWGYMRLGLTIVHFLFIALVTAYAAGSGTKIKPFPVFCVSAALAMSVTYGIRIDSSVGMIQFFAIVALDCVYFYSLWGSPKYSTSEATMLYDVFNRLFLPLKQLFVPFRSLFTKGSDGKNKSFGKILLGICISVPLVCILGNLLSRSDAAFEGLLNNVIGDSTEIFGQVIAGLILFPYIFSFAFSLRKKTGKQYAEPQQTSFRFIDSTVANTVLCIIGALYLVYLFAQLGYFFSAFSGLLPESFTYAEYARRGFFEICGISGINLALVFVCLACVKTKDGKLSPLMKAICTFVCVFTLVLIGTAMSKMYMYIGRFGMTRLRVLTSCFMVFLAVAFITAVIRIFARRFPYMKLLITAASVILLSVSFADVDYMVAKYNVDGYLNGTLKEIDVCALSELGTSGTSQIVRLLDNEDEQIQNMAYTAVYYRMSAYYSSECNYDSVDEYNDDDYYIYTNYFTEAYESSNDIRRFNLEIYKERQLLAGYKDKVNDYFSSHNLNGEIGYCYEW